MEIFMSIIGILFAYVLIRYREPIGEMIGDPEWAHSIGGIYNLLILLGIFIFFWSLATLTGTSDIFFSPILNLFKSSGIVR